MRSFLIDAPYPTSQIKATLSNVMVLLSLYIYGVGYLKQSSGYSAIPSKGTPPRLRILVGLVQMFISLSFRGDGVTIPSVLITI